MSDPERLDALLKRSIWRSAAEVMDDALVLSTVPPCPICGVRPSRDTGGRWSTEHDAAKHDATEAGKQAARFEQARTTPVKRAASTDDESVDWYR